MSEDQQDPPAPTPRPAPLLQRDGLTGSGALQDAAAVSVMLAPVVTPVVSQVTHKLLNRTPKEPSPQVVLPPGVDQPKR